MCTTNQYHTQVPVNSQWRT